MKNRPKLTLSRLSIQLIKNHMNPLLLLDKRVVFPLCLLLMTACSQSMTPDERYQKLQREKAHKEAFLLDDLKTDPSVTRGKLDNGLTYYIQENKNPNNLAELKMIVKIGSIVEEENEQGVAHFVEHMAFNGSRNFPKNELVTFLRQSGTEFGSDLNAYTTFNETVYRFQVPTEDPKVIEKGLLILKDWADGVNFDPEEVEKERKVVLEEARLYNTPVEETVWGHHNLTLRKESHYLKRMPIGQTKVIESVTAETLKKFYKTWYRPNLISVIAIGDLDRNKVEQWIQKNLSTLKNPPNEKERKDYPLHNGNISISNVFGQDFDYPNIELKIRKERLVSKKVHHLRHHWIATIYRRALNQRFTELENEENSPLREATASFVNELHKYKFYNYKLVLHKKRHQEGLTAFLHEIERMTRMGITEEELKREKKNLKSIYKSQLENRGDSSSHLAKEAISLMLSGRIQCSKAEYYDLLLRVLPTIEKEEINAFAKTLFTGKDMFLTETMPVMERWYDAPKLRYREELYGMKTMELTPYVSKKSKKSKKEIKKPVGELVKTKLLDKANITLLEFSNGTKVYLKPTKFETNQINFHAFSIGGKAMLSEKELLASEMIPSFFTKNIQNRFSNNVTLTPRIDPQTEQITGSIEEDELEELLQMVYWGFTTKEENRKAFRATKEEWKEKLERAGNRLTREEITLNNALLYTNPKLHNPMDQKDPERIEQSQLYRIIQDRFQNRSDFVFAIVGDFELEPTKKLVTAWLGGIPSTEKHETLETKKGSTFREEKDGYIMESGFFHDKSKTTIFFTANQPRTQNDDLKLYALEKLLEEHLNNILREELGQTYSLSVNYESKAFDSGSLMKVSFFSAPKNAKSMIRRVKKEIQAILRDGVDQKILRHTIAAELRNHEKDLRSNRYWSRKIVEYSSKKLDVQDIIKIKQKIQNLSVEELNETIQRYLNPKFMKIAIIAPKNAIDS